MNKGFTLVETLVAMVLASSILLPATFWLYRSHTTEAAREKFRAVQLLEMKMNRALGLRIEQDQSEEILGPKYLRLEIHLEIDGAESRLIGTAKNKKGQVVTSLHAAYFTGKLP